MKVLITGGAGNIGSRLAASLIRRGDKVVVLDVNSEPLYPTPEFSKADVCAGGVDDRDLVMATVAETRPDSIFHLAAILSGGAEQDPERTWRVNLEGTRNVLEAAVAAGVNRVVFTSTIATYGAGVPEPVNEHTPQWPSGLYGATKVAGERLGVYYHLRHGLDFRGVRLGAMVAPDAPVGGAASAFVCELYARAVQCGAYRLDVYPTTQLPVVWVDDVVHALVGLHDADGSMLRHRVYNIAAGTPSVQAMADAVVRRIPDVKIEFVPDPVRAPIVDSWPSAMDVSASHDDWGWHPAFDLEQMTDQVLREVRERDAETGR
ncbi:MAG: epimerase [Chloroflexi bacterium]|nr:epimerase [Chloroflexota bacterium]